MTSARALRPLDGPFGNLLPGDHIRGVEPATIAAWVAAGVAEYIDVPREASAPAEPEAPAGDGELEALGINQLRAKAKELGLSVGGKKPELIERIQREAIKADIVAVHAVIPVSSRD